MNGTGVPADRLGGQARFVDFFSHVVAAQGHVEGQGRPAAASKPPRERELAAYRARAQQQQQPQQGAQFSFLGATTPFLNRLPFAAPVHTGTHGARPEARPSTEGEALRPVQVATMAAQIAADRMVAQLAATAPEPGMAPGPATHGVEAPRKRKAPPEPRDEAGRPAAQQQQPADQQPQGGTRATWRFVSRDESSVS